MVTNFHALGVGLRHIMVVWGRDGDSLPTPSGPAPPLEKERAT